MGSNASKSTSAYSVRNYSTILRNGNAFKLGDLDVSERHLLLERHLLQSLYSYPVILKLYFLLFFYLKNLKRFRLDVIKVVSNSCIYLCMCIYYYTSSSIVVRNINIIINRRKQTPGKYYLI